MCATPNDNEALSAVRNSGDSMKTEPDNAKDSPKRANVQDDEKDGTEIAKDSAKNANELVDCAKDGSIAAEDSVEIENANIAEKEKCIDSDAGRIDLPRAEIVVGMTDKAVDVALKNESSISDKPSEPKCESEEDPNDKTNGHKEEDQSKEKLDKSAEKVAQAGEMNAAKETEKEEVQVVKTPLKSVVCILNCSTGKFEVVAAPDKDIDIDDETKNSAKGCSTPIQKYRGILNEQVLPSPCLSDIGTADDDGDNDADVKNGADNAAICCEGLEKLAIKDKNKLTATNELIAASVKEMKLNTDNEKVEKESDEVDKLKSRKSLDYCDKEIKDKDNSETSNEAFEADNGKMVVDKEIDESKQGIKQSEIADLDEVHVVKTDVMKQMESEKDGNTSKKHCKENEAKAVKTENVEVDVNDGIMKVTDNAPDGVASADNSKTEVTDLSQSKSDKSATSSQGEYPSQCYASDDHSSVFSDRQNSGFLLKSSEASGISSSSEREEVDQSILHRSSIHQFLTSRLNKSRSADNSGSISNSFVNGSLTTRVESKNGLVGIKDTDVYESELPETPFNDRVPDLDYSGFNDLESPSLTSFEQHENHLRGVAKSRTRSKYSDYSSNGPVAFPEGSFQGQGRHKDETLLGMW